MLTVAPTLGAALRVPVFRLLLDEFGPLNALSLWAGILLLSTLAIIFLSEPIKTTTIATDPTSTTKFFTFPLLLFISGVVLLASFETASALAPKYAELELGLSGPLAALSASLAQLASFVALLLLLLVGETKCLIGTNALMHFALLTNSVAFFVVSITDKGALFIALFAVLSASYSVAWALFPAALAERVEDVPRAYGVAYSASAGASAVWGALAGVLVDGVGEIRAYYYVSVALMLVALAAFLGSMLLWRAKGRRQEDVKVDVLLVDSAD